MNKSDCRLIGTLVKLHGVKGRYVMFSDSIISEDIEKWESVFLNIEGLLVPFFIDFINLTSDTSAVIGFDDIDSPEKAKEFVPSDVYQSNSLAGDDDDISPNQLEGYNVFDQKTGLVGSIEEILDYNQNLLFRILKKGQEILIPVSDDIIVSVNHKKKEIMIKAPEGLLDLYQ
jgi:16S rRNA processing protein RimM